MPARFGRRRRRSVVAAVALTTTTAYPAVSATISGHPPATSLTPNSPCTTEIQYATATVDPNPTVGSAMLRCR
jgi:hypothetical protein